MRNGMSEFLGCPGFHEKGINAQRFGFLGIRSVAEARPQDDWDIRTYATESASQGLTGYLGHCVIGNNEVKVMWSSLKDGQCLLAAGIGGDVIAELRQQRMAETHQRYLIVDKQNPPL